MRKETTQFKSGHKIPHQKHRWKNKHMERCLVSHTVRELQIKIAMRYHCFSTRMAKIKKKNDNTKYWWGHKATETLVHCWWESKMV